MERTAASLLRSMHGDNSHGPSTLNLLLPAAVAHFHVMKVPELTFVFLASVACAGTPSSAQEAQPTISKPRPNTNTLPAVPKARLDNRLSAEDRRGIFELVRTVYNNSPTPLTLTLVAGPEQNTVRVWRTANNEHEVAVETITLTKEKGRWKIQSILR